MTTDRDIEFAFVRDGSQVLLRPFRADDRSEAEALFSRLSPESWMLRFHSAGMRVPSRAVDLATAGNVVVAEWAGRLVGLASYVPLRDPVRAEMAIVVDDAEHGRGIGTVLFERLARDAQQMGIQRFLALVMANNRSMIEMVTGLGFRLRRTIDRGEIEFEVELRRDPTYVASADARRHVAAVASLEPIFQAQSVAVIGASRRRGTIGHEVFRNLLEGGFGGPVYPVNPGARSIGGVRAYPTLAEVPEIVDVAVVVVPAEHVLAVSQQCLDAGARSLVVISAGFAEVGHTGRLRQNELLRMCRLRGVRLVGPNCMGVLINGLDGAMNATFAPTLPPPGGVAFASQSGALGIAILEHAGRRGVGIASFVSMGNKADVSSNDLIEQWEDDESAKMIMLYIESFGNPRRFARLAKRVGTKKPIVVVKAGRSESGRRAAASHTAALAGSEIAIDALFRQAGVLRCETLEELFDVATLLSNQPLPAGNRVAIISNAGGLGIICADACEANGLVVPQLSPGTRAALEAILPAEAAVGNPVDMLASAPAERYGDVLKTVLADPAVDSAILLFIPPLVTQATDVAAALVAACDPPPEKPVLACFVGSEGIPESLRGARNIPSFAFPESAARALGHSASYQAWLSRPAGKVITFTDIDRVAARSIVDQATGKETWLAPQTAAALLAAYGIRFVHGEIVHSQDGAAAAFERIGGPVVVKLVSSEILHKSDVGGVRLGIESAQAAAEAYQAIESAVSERGLASKFEGALVQPMVTGGTECLVGVVTDPLFGPLFAFGLGGVTAEVIGDVRFRLQPQTDLDADELIASSKASKLLGGFRGAPAGDVAALRELILRLGQLIEDVPEVAELDLNPVIVREAGQGVAALDVRLCLRRQEA